MTIEPLPDTRHTRRHLPQLIVAAEHLHAVDQLARELMPCAHLPILPPTGDSTASVDDLNVVVDQLESALRFMPGCTCRTGTSRQLLGAYQNVVRLWGNAYAESAFSACYPGRRARRNLPTHVERLRRHRFAFEQLAFAHRTAAEAFSALNLVVVL